MSEMKNGKHVDKAGNINWFLNDQYHREDGPAIECTDGRKEWWIHGKRHRENGPAVEFPYAPNIWFLNHSEISESEFNQWRMKQDLNEKLHSTLPSKPMIKRGKI